MYHGKRVGAIITTRLASTRLPGKVLLSLKGKPSLQWIVERLKKSKHLDNIIIATANSASCDPIESLCQRINCDCFRGSEEDVLDRFVKAAHTYHLDVCIIITGDCPMVDPIIVDQVIDMFFQSECDFCSNAINRTFPRGFDVEVVSIKALDKANSFAVGMDRQHVATYIYKQCPENFVLKNLIAPKELRHPELRVTLDTLEDYVLIHTLYEMFEPNFTALDVVNILLAIPRLQQINVDVKQKNYKEG